MNPAAVKTVLLVDDDKVTNLMHSRLLRKLGLAERIEVATDGMAALERLESLGENAKPPEIIFLDLNMPRMNGFEFLDAYKRFPEALKRDQDIVMLSTSILHDDRKRAEADPDVRRFVVKPIRQNTLVEIFEGYHERRAR